MKQERFSPNHMEIHWHDYANQKYHVPITEASLTEQASVVGRVGLMLLSCGTGAWRIRQSMNSMAEQMGITCTADIGLMSVNYTCFAEGNCFSQSLCLTNTGVNTSKLNQLERWVEDFPARSRHWSGEQLHTSLDQIEQAHGLYSPFKLGMNDEFAEDDFVTESDPCSFAEVLFRSYTRQDISALLLEVCHKSMFDLLRDASLVPKRFCEKSEPNPVLLTDKTGEIVQNANPEVTAREAEKFRKIFEDYRCAPQSTLWLADGYEIVRTYTEELKIRERHSDRRRGILVLYELPDTALLGWTEAQAYAAVWDCFRTIQKKFPAAVVYYGQEAEQQSEQKFDELGILLPFTLFESKTIHCLSAVDKLASAFRRKLLEYAVPGVTDDKGSR